VAPVYLDCNATAPLRPEVVAAMVEALGACGNPSSVHGFGRRARARVEAARTAVAALAGAAPAEVIFTSGGTEANLLALRGAGRAVIAGATEHDSVLKAAPGAALVPVDGAGLVDLAALDRILAAAEGPALVALMLANNETGVIQPVAQAAAIAHARGAWLHCDAVQAAGKIPVDMQALGADSLALSAHKLGGPQGTGALVLRPGVALAPVIPGGGQERGRRAGTENVAAIHGFGVAAGLAREGLPAVAALRDGLEARLVAAAPGTRVFGREAARLPNTSCIAMPGPRAETQVMALDLAGFAVSAGAACSSGKVARSHVLHAMGAGSAADRAIRVSLGWATRPDEVDAFAEAWIALHRRLGIQAPAA